MPVKIPTSLKDVNEEWLYEALIENNKDFDNDLKILSITPIKVKNGFLSDVAKATIQVGNEEKKIFIKAISDPNDPLRSFMDDNNFDEIEIKFYKEHLPALIDFDSKRSPFGSSLTDIVPNFYAGNLE